MAESHSARLKYRGASFSVLVAVAVGIIAITSSTLVAYLGTTSNNTAQATLIGIAGVITGYLIVLSRGIRPGPLSLYAVFAYSHAAIFIARPAFAAASQSGFNIFTGADAGGYMVAAGSIGATGFVGMSLCYMLFYPTSRMAAARQKSATVPRYSRVDRSRILFASGVVFVIGLGLFSAYVQQLGGWGAFLAVNVGRSAELTAALASSSGYLYSGLLMTNGVALLVLTIGLIDRSMRVTAFGLVMLAVGVAPQIMTGTRSVFVPIATAIVIIVMRTRPGLITPFRAAVVGVPLFIFGFVAPRIFRSEITSTKTIQDAILEAFSPQGLLDGFFGGLDTAMIDAFALQIEAQATGVIQQLGGSTYLAALGSIVPRTLWPDKPFAVDVYLNQVLFPITAAKKIGFSFGVYSEPYLNWGVLGVLLVLGIFGVVLAQLEVFIRAGAKPFMLVAIALLCGLLFAVVRGSISYDLQRLAIPVIPLLFVWLFTGRPRPAGNGVGADGRKISGGTVGPPHSHRPYLTQDTSRSVSSQRSQ